MRIHGNNKNHLLENFWRHVHTWHMLTNDLLLCPKIVFLESRYRFLAAAADAILVCREIVVQFTAFRTLRMGDFSGGKKGDVLNTLLIQPILSNCWGDFDRNWNQKVVSSAAAIYSSPLGQQQQQQWVIAICKTEEARALPSPKDS